MQEVIELRSIKPPYPNAPCTWVMDLDATALRPSRPAAAFVEAAMDPGCPQVRQGFWNDMPIDERREPVRQMEPTYGRSQYRLVLHNWVDIRELALFLSLTYAVIGLTHVAIKLMCYLHQDVASMGN